MLKRTDLYFRYPSNLNILDLATLVSMYRSRGEPRKAPAGDYFACHVTYQLIKEAKWWFGMFYSQEAWDKLLTKGSGGYPLTEVELNILGMSMTPPNDNNDRQYIENNCGSLPQMAFLIVNDLKQFGFLEEDDNNHLFITNNGEKALNGISKRIYEKKYVPEMLHINQVNVIEPTVTQAQKKSNSQIDLF
ncbi:MAG TPA: hypothetical protein VJ991_01795 [Balneolales bacterium]|nr:hypothetical protein [Balneolales bacterium]